MRFDLRLYPELEHEHDLFALIRRLIAGAGYSLDALANDRLKAGHRSASANVGARERIFIFELWSRGVCYGAGNCSEPGEMAEAMGAFLVGSATIDEMNRRFPWVKFRGEARAHERGELVDYSWRTRLERDDEIATLLMPLLRACARRPRLRSLLPFTSHEVLCFSRTTGFPFDTMPARARPVFDPSSTSSKFSKRFVPDRYEVLTLAGVPIQASSPAPHTSGQGDADWTAEALQQEIPAHWGPAVDGTKDDMV